MKAPKFSVIERHLQRISLSALAKLKEVQMSAFDPLQACFDFVNILGENNYT